MTIAANLLQAIILGLVASGLYSLITSSWAWRGFVALAAALALVAWAVWSGPFVIG